MTPDRKTLLEYVAKNMYTSRCPCGRCDCASSDPFKLAARVLFGWAGSYQRLAIREAERAIIYEASAARYRELVAGGNVPATEDAERAEAAARKHRRRSRSYDRSARRYERISLGLPPFAAWDRDEKSALVGLDDSDWAHAIWFKLGPKKKKKKPRRVAS